MGVYMLEDIVLILFRLIFHILLQVIRLLLFRSISFVVVALEQVHLFVAPRVDCPLKVVYPA